MPVHFSSHEKFRKVEESGDCSKIQLSLSKEMCKIDDSAGKWEIRKAPCRMILISSGSLRVTKIYSSHSQPYLNSRKDRTLRNDRISSCLQARRCLSQFKDISHLPKLKFPGMRDLAAFFATVSPICRSPHCSFFIAPALIFCAYARLVLTKLYVFCTVNAEKYIDSYLL